MKSILPRNPVEKIIKSASEKQGITRVSKEAVDEMIDTLQKIGISVGEQAVKLAEHANRKTIKSKDIELAHIK